MKARERLITTFQGNKADRVPVSPFIFLNNIYEMFQYKPDIDHFLSPQDFDVAEKFVAYHDYFGFDVLFHPDCYGTHIFPKHRTIGRLP